MTLKVLIVFPSENHRWPNERVEKYAHGLKELEIVGELNVSAMHDPRLMPVLAEVASGQSQHFIHPRGETLSVYDQIRDLPPVDVVLVAFSGSEPTALMIDAHLRDIDDQRVLVVGVCLQQIGNNLADTAATLSLREAYGSRVIHRDSRNGTEFVGGNGLEIALNWLVAHDQNLPRPHDPLRCTPARLITTLAG